MRDIKREDIYAFLAELEKINHNESTALLLHWYFGKEISIPMCYAYIEAFEEEHV